MNPEQSRKAGKSSGIARLTPDVICRKAEIVRLHTADNLGVSAIATRTNTKKGLVRRWLVQAGVYSVGTRPAYPVDHVFRQGVSGIAKEYARETRIIKRFDGDAYWARHPDARRARVLACYYRNHDASKARSRARAKDAYSKQTSETKLKRLLRARIYNAIKRQGPGHKAKSTMELIGCTIPELRRHLESKMANGMSWANYGEWHVDHIRPCASFNLQQAVQQAECFHYSNLQPLWGSDNISKGDKWQPTPPAVN